MWLSVSVPGHGMLCIDVSNADPSVYDVQVILGQLLHLDISQYDFMLGTYQLSSSMLLADFGLLDGNGELTLTHRACTERDTSRSSQDILQTDPIEDCSPNISESDPIEFTPAEQTGRTAKRRPLRKSHKRNRSTSVTCDTAEKFAFPKWNSSA